MCFTTLVDAVTKHGKSLGIPGDSPNFFHAVDLPDSPNLRYNDAQY